jgi:CDP-diacylglycerol---glycerol-3-phosphate 3-phosphatidyltransferase
VSDGLDQRTRRARANGRSGALSASEMRTLARSRLIESRLTPNAISINGRYSRMSGKGSPFGAFLDSTLDRIEEGVVLAAVATWFAKSSNEIAAGATVLTVVGSYMVSYTRARAEALGVECKVGIASRAVRVVILSAGLLFAAGELIPDFDLLEPAIYAMAALTIFTTFQRVFHVRKQLAVGAPPV